MEWAFRDFLWLRWHGQLPSAELTAKEILLALVIGGVLLASWLGVRRLCFYLAQQARPARLGAWVMCITLAVSWVIASLDLFEYWTFLTALLILLLGVSLGVAILLRAKYRKIYSI